MSMRPFTRLEDEPNSVAIWGIYFVLDPYGLILSIIAHDGNRFPKFLRNIQALDFKNYVRIGESFKRTKRYVKFQDEVIECAERVAA